MTPSLVGFFWSIGYAVAFVVLVTGALFVISQKDKIIRRG